MVNLIESLGTKESFRVDKYIALNSMEFFLYYFKEKFLFVSYHLLAC